MNQSHTVLIPPGAFIMGTDIESFYGTALANSAHAKLDEAPMHVRFLEAYRIAQYPVTNAEYATFVEADAASAACALEKWRVCTGRGKSACCPSELARLQRVRAMGRQAIADRSGMGEGMPRSRWTDVPMGKCVCGIAGTRADFDIEPHAGRQSARNSKPLRSPRSGGECVGMDSGLVSAL